MKILFGILLIISFLYTFTDNEASGYENMYSSPYLDLYGDTLPILVQKSKSIDLSSKDPSLRFHKEELKSIGRNFNEFARASVIPYMWNWTERLIIAPGNVKNVFTNSISQYFHNISGWQGCKLDSPGCDNIRTSFWDFPFSDGDFTNTNYFQHPLSGMATYLYYRQIGFDRVSAGFGSAMHSFLFEYTIEAWQQPPSFNDLIVTPALGIPIGIVVEISSDWLGRRDSQFLRALSYIVNPAKILIPEGDIYWQGLGGFSFRFNLY